MTIIIKTDLVLFETDIERLGRFCKVALWLFIQKREEKTPSPSDWNLYDWNLSGKLAGA